MKVLLIDNYDSFTYNLAQLLERSGRCSYDVVLNDQIGLRDIDTYDKILISPGPGLPADAGITCNIIRTYGAIKPILGICLGHQAIAEVYGARLYQMAEPQHGQTRDLHVTEPADVLFKGLSPVFQVTLYHSWSVERNSVPDCLQVTALSPGGQVLALRHRDFPVWGVQFHPESVATQHGFEIVMNWLGV